MMENSRMRSITFPLLSGLLCLSWFCWSASADPSHLLWHVNETFPFEANAIRVWDAGFFSSYDPPNGLDLRMVFPPSQDCGDCKITAFVFDSKEALKRWEETGIIKALWYQTFKGIPGVEFSVQVNASTVIHWLAFALKNVGQTPIPALRWEANVTSNASLPLVCPPSGNSSTNFTLMAFQPAEDYARCPSLPLQLNCSQAGKELEFTGAIHDASQHFQAELHYNRTLDLSLEGRRCDGLVFVHDNTTYLDVHCRAEFPELQPCYYFYRHHNGSEPLPPPPPPSPDDSGWTNEKTYLVVIGVLSLVAAVCFIVSVVLFILHVKGHSHRYHVI
ncbi:hypothetical protein QOT17_006219 [Balamuthia mandrillaris]